MTLLILLLCALLEVGGDALMRRGMNAPSLATRLSLCAGSALVLASYAWLVNKPEWAFNKLLGVYVVLFFVVSQIVGAAIFNDRLTPAILAGGALIVAGGAVIALAQH